MTERDYWLEFAEAWKKAKKDRYGGGEYYARYGRLFVRNYGICSMVCCVSDTLYDPMKDRMLSNRPTGKSSWRYWWSTTTLKGAKSRAAFCRRMAKLCEQESREIDNEGV